MRLCQATPFWKFSWRLKLPPSPAQRVRCILWLKSKILNYKKGYNKQKYFSVITKNSRWESLTQNLVTFKKKMVLRMKKALIFWIFTKNPTFRGVFTKNQYRGGRLNGGGAWTVCWFKGGLVRRRGGTFEGEGLITQCTQYFMFMNTFLIFFSCFSLTKMYFSLFHFFFVIKYQIFTPEY